MPSFIDRLTRRKIVTFEDRQLSRVLNTLDLTALGIGSTVGVGFYVIAGEVARNVAGPAVTVSFLIAAVASVFAGLCYAEFGARVPKAGSAYIYTYVCVGEFTSFIIGWNLILEYVIGTASVATGFSGYIDQIANNKISNALTDAMPIKVSFLSKYPDFLAFGLTLSLTLVLSLGVRESSRMNNIFTAINLLVITYVIIAAGTQANFENWSIPESKLNKTCENSTEPEDGWGVGGFAPYGFNGIIQGAATCFFGFVGFDVIATTGEEAINPERTIPIAISLSLLFVFVAYFGMSSVITLAIPYCTEDVNAPLIYLFQSFGWETATWIVSIGAMFGFSASLFGAMFPLPRVIFAMADDGLLFRFLSAINKVFHTPIVATILSGFFAGLMAMFFDLSALVDMMSIGTLMAYGIVALCVMLLRYTGEEDTEPEAPSKSQCVSPHLSNLVHSSSKDYFLQLFNVKGLKEPTDFTATLVSYAVLIFFVLSVLLSIILVVQANQIASGDGGAISAVVILALLIVINLFAIARQPESKKKLSFKVPFVPWLPGFSALFNMYLMCNLTYETWIRFAIWMVIGLLIYFGYGLKHSTEEQKSGTSEYGLNNPGFVGDGEQNINKATLIIPTIEIHPATPTNSEPNTPTVSHKTKQKPHLPQSPLVSVESETKQTVRIDDSTEKSEGQFQNTLASLGHLISDSGKVKQEQLQCETSGSYLDDNETSESYHEDDWRTLKDHDEDRINIPNDVQPRKVPLLHAEIFSTNNDEDKQGPSKSKNDIDSGNSEINTSSLESVHLMLEKKSEILNGNVENKPECSAVQDIKSEVTKAKFTEEVIGGSENCIKSEFEDKEHALAVEVMQKGGNSKTSHGHAKEGESSCAKMNENNVAEDSNERPEGDTVDHSVLRSSQSAPILPPPPPPPPPPPSLAGYSYSSVPSTPVSKRHPFKILKRMSSFDDIPPSSPDSPLARRLGNKFVIIPVKELGANSDVDNSSQISPHVNSLTTEKTPETQQEMLMKELLSKLGNQSELSKKEFQEDNKKHLLFTVGSDDSLESSSSGANSESFVSDLTSSAITGQTREFKKVFSKESVLEVLDTIRERGESKILHVDEDKPDIKDPVPKILVGINSVNKNSSEEKFIQEKVESVKQNTTDVESPTTDFKSLHSSLLTSDLKEKLNKQTSLSGEEKISEEKDIMKKGNDNENKTDGMIQQQNEAYATAQRGFSSDEKFSKLRAMFDS